MHYLYQFTEPLHKLNPDISQLLFPPLPFIFFFFFFFKLTPSGRGDLVGEGSHQISQPEMSEQEGEDATGGERRQLLPPPSFFFYYYFKGLHSNNRLIAKQTNHTHTACLLRWHALHAEQNAEICGRAA